MHCFNPHMALLNTNIIRMGMMQTWASLCFEFLQNNSCTLPCSHSVKITGTLLLTPFCNWRSSTNRKWGACWWKKKPCGFFGVFQTLELQNRSLRYSENMNPDKKKICCKILVFSCSGDISVSCEKEISMNVSLSHLWNKSTDSVKCRGEKMFWKWFYFSS